MKGLTTLETGSTGWKPNELTKQWRSKITCTSHTLFTLPEIVRKAKKRKKHKIIVIK